MKKALKITGMVLAVLAIAVGAFLGYVNIRGIPSYPVPRIQFQAQSTPQRVERGRKLARLLCISCHFDPATGALTGKYMSDVPTQFGSIYGPNITQDEVHGIGSWRDDELAYLLRTGIRRDGRYEPPYMIKLPHASDEDIASIIAFLRSDDPMVKAAPVPSHPLAPSFFTKMLCYFAFKPLPYPSHPIATPDRSDKAAYGRYLADGLLDCYGCHSANFQTNDPLQPERSVDFYGGGNSFRGADGATILSSNITPDESTGIGSWNETQFVKAMRQGFRPDRSPLRHPMPIYSDLDDVEVSAIFAYLRTVPPLAKTYPRPATVAFRTGPPGQQIYQKYGCDGCHGNSGDGPIDIRDAIGKYPADQQLIAFLKQPAASRPTTQMPAFDGMIAEEEYAPLVAHIRSLQTHRAAAHY